MPLLGIYRIKLYYTIKLRNAIPNVLEIYGNTVWIWLFSSFWKPETTAVNITHITIIPTREGLRTSFHTRQLASFH